MGEKLLEEIVALKVVYRGLTYEMLRDQVTNEKLDTAPLLLLHSHATPSAFFTAFPLHKVKWELQHIFTEGFF